MKRIMFVCKQNSARSQMAEGFAKHLGVNFLSVTSAGLEVAPITADAIAVMKDAGVDISRQTPKLLNDFHPEDFDIVISMCGASLPSAWAAKEFFADWHIDDPTEQPEISWRVRDEIRAKVVELIESLQTNKVCDQ
jgi:arsenate reductase (thioredoxin)